MGDPVLLRLVQPFHVAVLPGQPHLVQRGRIKGAQARVSPNPPLAARRGQPRLGAFPDQGTLELRRGPQHLQGELALRRGRVDRIGRRPEVGPLGLQSLDHLEEMRERPREAVDAHHNQRIALTDPLQHAGQHGSRAVPA